MEQITRFCKTFTFKRRTASGRISSGPALVCSAHLVAGDGTAGKAALFDGHTANGELKIDLSAPANGADPRSFIPPIWFDQAVYLVLGENVTSVFVTMQEVRGNGARTQKQGFRSWLKGWLGWPPEQEQST